MVARQHTHNVQRAARIVRRFSDKLNETVNGQNVDEFHSVWVDCPFEVNVDVASEQNGVSKRQQSTKEISKLGEKVGGYSGRARSIKNDDNELTDDELDATRTATYSKVVDCRPTSTAVRRMPGTATTATPPCTLVDVLARRQERSP